MESFEEVPRGEGDCDASQDNHGSTGSDSALGSVGNVSIGTGSVQRETRACDAVSDGARQLAVPGVVDPLPDGMVHRLRSRTMNEVYGG